MKTYPNLSAPITIGNVTVKNRMMMAPMDTGFGNTPDNNLTPEGVEYFVRRARGGFGLLFSGGTNVDGPVDGVPCILDDPAGFVSVGRGLNERLAAYGCKMFVQLTLNIGRNAGLKGPSELPVWQNPSATTPALTVEEIHTKVREMGEAAKLVKDAGYAGVDIHALHWGHLIDSFALSFMNRRDDEYGGSLQNRLRICKEIREAIAETCGWDFPVSMRVALKSYMRDFDKASFDGSEEVGRTLEEAVEICKLLEEWGYDALSTDAGTLDAFYYAMPPAYVPAGSTVDLAAEVKRHVKIPVLCGSRFADEEIAEAAIAEGKVDAAVIGRQAIADPDYAAKIAAGTPERVRTCIGCNQGCIWGYFTRGHVFCAVNPEVGMEARGGIAPAAERKRVVVVGGGVAGMEAACVAHLRGHDVTLLEKSDHLGGNLIPAGNHDFKYEVAKLNRYFVNEMGRLGIDVRLNAEATPEGLRAMGADALILALGSVPVMPRSIQGIDHPKAISGTEACMGAEVGDKVVVVGGGLVGCEIAYGYAKEGKQVTVVEALDDILLVNDVPGMNKMFLTDAFEHYGVRVMASTSLKAVTDDGAMVAGKDGAQETIEADAVVISVGYRPLPSMAGELTGCGAQVFEIGDGAHVGNVLTCIRDAYEVALGL